MTAFRRLFACSASFFLLPVVALSQTWTYTEGAAGGGRYSALDEIDRGNVAQLEQRWSYQHGDFQSGGILPDKVNRGSAFESTPIVIGRRLIFTTPFSRVIALDAASGAELWSFDPEVDTSLFFANMLINRGVAWWRSDDPSEACAERIFVATLDARLIALDLATGKPCPDFAGATGIDLRADLAPLTDPMEYNVTSPPTVVGDAVIVGSSIADTVRRQAAPGDVRAYDARSGKRLWTFHTIPKPGTFGADTWQKTSGAESGAANVWSTMVADVERGWVFLPVSTPSPDYYGGDRPGSNLFSDSLVALDARTGERKWHFQTVHHDLWDYDLAAPPVLVTLERDGAPLDAVALPTKHGFVFVLERATGKPVWPVEERAAPPSPIATEAASPTQPHPTRPPRLLPESLSEADLNDRTPAIHAACKKRYAELRNEGLFTPPGTDEALVYPYSAGGANWSGSTWDPQRQQLVVPINDLAHVIRLRALPASNFDDVTAQPMSNYWNGVWFILRGRGTGLRYQLNPLGGRTLFAAKGEPCNKPPWGWLVAVDLAKGEIAWRVPAGGKDGIEGLSNFGPALSTAGGLIFHGGTRDQQLRAHDADTGEVLARWTMPAGLHAGPITYKLSPDEPQMLVVAPGGHVGSGTELGDWVIGYALPD